MARGLDGVPPGLGPHVFVEDIGTPALAPEDRHHLEHVLRLRRGDSLTISDGQGSWRSARLGPELEAAGPEAHQERREPPITIAFALVKGERPELVTQKLTELGVDRIVPFAAERSVVRWDADRSTRQVTRLRKVAREAAMQCRRCWLPEVADLASFAEVVRLPGAVGADRGGDPPSLANPVVMVGPEGGWSEQELRRLPGRIDLGEQVLRAETAAITAAALLAALRRGLVSEAG